MKILIVGNLGYIGPVVTAQLRKTFPDAELIGFDIGYFSHCLTNSNFVPEVYLNRQTYGDVRKFPESLLEGVTAVVDLAAISNDPIGNLFEKVTLDVNHKAAVQLAKIAKKAGVQNFVYASSCSIYGAADDSPRKETDTLNPLTAYARSKVMAERDLQQLADNDFIVTCFRFATACGFSSRLRLDLVLNDFVAGALVNKEISILSDGTPWRPLIHIKDMARAIEWGILRNGGNGSKFLAVNTGSNSWNNQIGMLAEEVASVIPGVRVDINKNAQPDKRSYKVSFDLYEKLAPDHQPLMDLRATIQELHSNLSSMKFNDSKFRESDYIRLRVISKLRSGNFLNEELEWMI